MPIRSQAIKIYGARKKKIAAVKCQGYFTNKEKMGFAINTHLIKYRNTVTRVQRLPSVSSAPAYFKCRYTSLLSKDSTETVASIAPALIARLS